ncbi:hypothetical protein ABPG77_003263, partial [Micractinium sp. CCAP 211/92]
MAPSIEAQLRSLKGSLQAEELSDAVLNQLLPTFLALTDRLEELSASTSSSPDLVQLLRSLVPLGKPLAALAERCRDSLSDTSPRAFRHCRAVLAMARTAHVLPSGLERQEQLPAASRLSTQELAQLLDWLAAMFPACAALMSHGLLGSSGDGASPAFSWAPTDVAWFAIVWTARNVQPAASHCIKHARKPQYAAALQQLRRCVPLYLASLVPSLAQLPPPGQPDSDLQAYWHLFLLLSTLIQEPELAESAKLALASGPADNPLGQQLATNLLPFVRGLADSVQLQPPTTDVGQQGSAASENSEDEQGLVLCLKGTVSIFGTVQPHAQAAMAAGPAWLEAMQALVSMLGRLMQQQKQQQQQQAGASSAAENACMLLDMTLAMLDLILLCQCELFVACDASARAGQQPPQPQLEQRCLAVSLAAWQATEAAPAVAALLEAPWAKSQRVLCGARNLFRSLGMCFAKLTLTESCPRWSWPQSLLLPAALEAALRCAARLQLSQHGLEAQITELVEKAVVWCEVSLLYLGRFAQPQAQQAAGQQADGQARRAGDPVELPPADDLLRRLAALASTALKVTAVLCSRRGTAAPPLSKDSLEARLLGIVGGCCKVIHALEPISPDLQASRRAS